MGGGQQAHSELNPPVIIISPPQPVFSSYVPELPLNVSGAVSTKNPQLLKVAQVAQEHLPFNPETTSGKKALIFSSGSNEIAQRLRTCGYEVICIDFFLRIHPFFITTFFPGSMLTCILLVFLI